MPVDINAEAVDQSAKEISGAGGTASPICVDITDYAAVRDAVAELELTAGAIDILINNAGWDRFVNFLDSEPSLWDRIIAINLRGPINLHHAVLPGMVARGGGRVVNIASDAGRVGSSGEAVYSACKGGIIAFTKTVARELARTGVTLNTVCPGPTLTPFLASFIEEEERRDKILEAFRRAIPMRRLGQPDDIPGIVTFLASDEAAFITGQVISVSGGLTMHG